MRNFILFSSIYVCVFSGYYLTTSFLNILYPEYAFWSFVTFYGVYALGSIFSVLVVHKLNLKVTLFLSCLTFCIFVGFAGSNILAMLMVGSFVGGLGNSVIWLVQGTFLESNEMGNFYMLFNINIIFGNLFGLIVLLSGLSPQIMILSMTGICFAGVILSFFVKEKEKSVESEEVKKNESGEEKREKEENVLKKLLNIFKGTKDVYFLIPSYVYQAIGLNVTYQIIPRVMWSTCLETEKMKNIYNAIIFLVYGVFAMGFSWLWGKLLVGKEKDAQACRNWKFVVIPYSILEVLTLLTIFILGKYNTECGYWIIVGACRGIIDYGINNTINITLSEKFPEKITSHFSLFRFIYAISYLITSILIGYIPYPYILLTCLISLLSSTTFYSLFQKYN